MALRQVEQVRARIATGFANELVRIRGFLSLTEGNAEAIEKLRGKEGNTLLATMTDVALKHLGHVTSGDGRAARMAAGHAGRGQRITVRDRD